MNFKKSIYSDFFEVDKLVEELESFFDLSYIAEKKALRFVLILIVRELLINAIEHGNKMVRERKADLELELGQKRTIIIIKDEGSGFSLPDAQFCETKINDLLSERGRGMLLLKQYGCIIENTKDNKIRVTLRYSDFMENMKEEVEMSELISAKKEERVLNIVLHTDLVASRLEEYVEKSKEYIDEDHDFDVLALDLNEVKYVDSKGITFVVGVYKTATSMKKVFKVVGLRKDIYDLFQLMRLGSLFQLEQKS